MTLTLGDLVSKLGLEAQREAIGSAAVDLDDATPWYVTALAGFGTWIGALLVGIGLALSSLLNHDVARVFFGGGLLVLAPLVARASTKAVATQAALIGVVAGEVLLFSGLGLGATGTLLVTLAVQTLVIAAVPRPLTRGMATLALLSALVGLCERWHIPVDAVPLGAGLVGVVGFLIEPRVLTQPWSRLVRPVATASLLGWLGFWTAEAAAATVARGHSPFVVAAPALQAIVGAAALVAIALQQRVRGLRLAGVVVAAVVAAVLSLSLPGLVVALVVVITGIVTRARLLSGVATAFLLFFLGLTYWRLDLSLLNKALWSSSLGALLFVVRALVGRGEAVSLTALRSSLGKGGRQAQRGVVVAIAAAAVFVVVISGLVVSKERTLHQGRRVLLPLLPADPRSLAQGDYMSLRTELATQALQEIDEQRRQQGVIIVDVDENAVGHFARIDRGTALAPSEVRLRYRVDGHHKIHVGAEDMFFEEGQAARFSKARYGEVRVDHGNVVLVGLCGEDRQHL